MRFAYLILAHDAFDQLERLAARLLKDGPDDALFIHVDRKSRIPPDFLRTVPEGVRSRIHVLTRRVPVRWAHHSQCRATLALLDAALPGPFDYFHLLSGRDWPLVPRERIDADIEAAGAIDVFVDIEDADFGWRMDNFCFKDRMLHADRKALPLLWPYGAMLVRISKEVNAACRRRGRARGQPLGRWAKGSQWWTLPRDAAAHARDRLAELLASGRLRWTQCSDEHVIQTALVNTQFGRRIAGNRRLIKWRPGAWSPEVLTAADAAFDGGNWFARKFDASRDESFYAL